MKDKAFPTQDNARRRAKTGFVAFVLLLSCFLVTLGRSFKC